MATTEQAINFVLTQDPQYADGVDFMPNDPDQEGSIPAARTRLRLIPTALDSATARGATFDALRAKTLSAALAYRDSLSTALTAASGTLLDTTAIAAAIAAVDVFIEALDVPVRLQTLVPSYSEILPE